MRNDRRDIPTNRHTWKVSKYTYREKVSGMRCNNCIHYDVCYQYDIIGEDDSEMCALYEQKRPHGEWIYHREWALDGECAFECSNCNMGVDLDFNFCPNCGEPMEVEEGDEK